MITPGWHCLADGPKHEFFRLPVTPGQTADLSIPDRFSTYQSQFACLGLDQVSHCDDLDLLDFQLDVPVLRPTAGFRPTAVNGASLAVRCITMIVDT